MPKSHPIPFRMKERSESNRPAYIYIIQNGSDFYYLARYDEAISVSGLPSYYGPSPQTFTSAQVDHSTVQQTSEIKSNRMTVSIGINSGAAATALRANFLTAIPNATFITIARVNSESLTNIGWSNDCYTVFKGVVFGVGGEGQQLNLSCLSQLMNLDGKVPNFFYQKTCQHALYDDKGAGSCQSDPLAIANSFTTTLTGANGRFKTVDIAELTIDSNPITNETFRGGLLWELDGGSPIARTNIVGSSALPASAGTRLYISAWVQSLAVSTSVRVIRGCARMPAACATHGQLANYGGTPYVPTVNPVVHGVK